MKNISIKLFSIIFMMTLFNCKSQIVIDLFSNTIPVPENYNQTGQYYEKDINNRLLPFVGTWEYINGNEKFQIILTKITKYHFVMPNINLNVYQDGIALQYKNFINGNLVYESPITGEPTFTDMENSVLIGAVTDYGRITKTLYKPQMMGGGVYNQGGEYFYPICRIEKVFGPPSGGTKIKFKLYTPEGTVFGNSYDNPIYAGQPRFSIPNDVILTKVP
ncbi:hypothetical protein CHRY9390_01892 [Chryseobacterium aquaeductus]|uniref:DUF6705 domain-containing protein n=2 Tax=Chryseobacterium aquaeductus TaxID=2675056 RepID=A0A9N8MGN9_9FLAO|nr:hypothetical protein CHRY9390_01892 [Chryseobacterium potabilaquae]CAD7808808.1 hypothetical protein CHRY9390_01892 [Chryseobacterium aquaeductus]